VPAANGYEKAYAAGEQRRAGLDKLLFLLPSVASREVPVAARLHWAGHFLAASLAGAGGDRRGARLPAPAAEREDRAVLTPRAEPRPADIVARHSGRQR